MKCLCSFVFFLISGLCFLTPGKADSWAHLQQGDQTAQAFLNQLDQKRGEAGSHPFYQGIPAESNYRESDLVGRSQGAAANDPASQMVIQSSDARPQIKIDPITDPLLIGANKVQTNPLEVIGGAGTQVVEVTQGGTTEAIVCEEPGEDSIETCTRELSVKITKSKVQKEWRGAILYSKCINQESGGHYLPCVGLRNAGNAATWALSNANSAQSWSFDGYDYHKQPIDKNAVLDITASYKACMAELNNYRPQGCTCHAQLPALGIPATQIIKVSLETHSSYPWLIHLQSDYFSDDKHGRTEYNIQPYVNISYQADSYKVLPDEWVDNCDRLEERADQGLCNYVSRKCTQGPQTRTIQGVSITRPCWQETLTYACSYPAKDDCGPLRARGCAQLTSACKQYVGKACVAYHQTYQCKEAPRTMFQIQGASASTLKVPFCMDGNCRDQGWEPNDELMSSLAQLNILKEMQGQLEGGILFKGTDNRCSKCTLSFKDCCRSGKGWGTDLGLASCSANEKLLNKRRKAGLCHTVGTYCAKKVLNKCVKKKTSYCCFGSKLLKAFHEQGRVQIGMGWGEPKEPLCRGFTIEEIQRIDFSKLDLSEFFEDLMKTYSPGKMGNISQQVSDRLETIKKGLTSGRVSTGTAPHSRQPQPKQREGGA